jgi:DNA polymerase-3 subunit delta'
MSLAKLVGNDSIKQWLKNALRAKRLPGALIFSGPSGVGKQQFAIELAKALNCPNLDSDFNSCDNCSTCHRISLGEFIDTKVIVPDGQFIKVDQVRTVIDEIYFRPFEGNFRVYIFESAEKFREQAANALLKTLEEPPSTSILILITSSPDSLLPTILSRTIKLHFTPLSDEALRIYLTNNYPRPETEQKLLIKLSQGSIGRALSIDISEYKQRRQECLEMLSAVATKNQPTILLKTAETLGKKERVDFDKYLETIFILLQDLTHLQISPTIETINTDIYNNLLELATKSPSNIFAKLACRLLELERELVRNINRQMTLENIFLTIK